MLKLRSLFAVLTLALALTLAQGQQPADAADTKPGLFVNLTTDDTWSATKAIMFAHQKALKNGLSPVVVWLNVQGIYLADAKRPSPTHGLMKDNLHEMLQAFMQDGGIVYACQACSAAAGLVQTDFIDGVQMGNQEAILGLLADPKVKTLAW
ncbi:DsrE family protein [Pelagibius sp.]|uniref:DsrE family protein n=1 Tax=Pelagibius sp. TaxID=1931238 RepID=UPI003B511A69